MGQDTILVFDFGGQYCHLIARRVRDNKVHSEIVQCDITEKALKELNDKFSVKGIILSGGPASIYEKDSPRMDKGILDAGIPVLGICYGHQLIASYVGGEVKPSKKKEFGTAIASIDKSDVLFRGFGKREQVWMSHGDTVLRLPDSFEALAHTSNCPIAAFKHKKKKIYGIQWHPEVVHTQKGGLMLKNFIFRICGCRPDWVAGNLVQRYVEDIKNAVGGGRAIVALSGGVDSSTAAAMTARAIGSNLTAVYVDHGLMRINETEQVRGMAKKLGINLVQVDAKERFLKSLEGVSEPELKRKIIGREFIGVFEEAAKKIGAEYLVQGTIYPDRIESGKSKKSAVIKSHHNVGGMPTKIKFKGLIEPLKDLYKDEVRRMARQLGLPESMVNRQPFPGPGMAVRIMGDITDQKLDILKRADAIVTGEIEKGTKRSPWQYFAVLTDTRSTGVKGDARSYGYVVAVRAVESREAMTASFSKIPYDTLERISTRITNEIPEVVRVVYDITNKPPATIEWE